MRENKPRQNFHPSERSRENPSNISELTEKEQEHRHQWQDKYLKSYSSSFRMGQVFGLIYNIALLFVIYNLIKEGEKDLAIKIFTLNIAIIAFAILVTSIERKILSRKPMRKGKNPRFNKPHNNHERRHHHNNDQNRDNRGSGRDNREKR